MPPFFLVISRLPSWLFSKPGLSFTRGREEFSYAGDAAERRGRFPFFDLARSLRPECRKLLDAQVLIRDNWVLSAATLKHIDLRKVVPSDSFDARGLKALLV
jgi:hypothetical protein